jgi:hypothetical protein
MNNFERIHFREIKRRTEELEKQKRSGNNGQGDWVVSWTQAVKELKEKLFS